MFISSSSVNPGKTILWNLDKIPSGKSFLIPAKAPLFGFWVATKAKLSFILIVTKPFPVISELNILLSKACCIHWSTDGCARFISSNNKILPSRYAFKNGPSSILNFAKEFWSPTYLEIKSSIFVSWLKLNLRRLSSSSLV